jgi:hypothetical protein
MFVGAFEDDRRNQFAVDGAVVVGGGGIGEQFVGGDENQHDGSFPSWVRGTSPMRP